MSETTVLPVQGKLVAIVPEAHYTQTGQRCPFPECKSTLLQKHITDNKEMEGDYIADTMQCPECHGTYVVVSIPRMHFTGNIILNWSLTEKGVSKYAKEQGDQAASGHVSDTGSISEDAGESSSQDAQSGDAILGEN